MTKLVKLSHSVKDYFDCLNYAKHERVYHQHTYTQWRTEGAQGASRPERHLRRGRNFGENVNVYVKNVKINVKKVKFCVNMDRRAENLGRQR